MNTTTISTTTRLTTATRRGSLRALGGAALSGVLAAPAPARAGKSGKNAQKRCKRQREQCQRVFEERCLGSAVCEAAYAPCCEHFGRCDTGQGLECIFRVD